MEEKVTTNGQTGSQTNQQGQPEISYQDLKNVAIQLKRQNGELIQQNNELYQEIQNINNIEKRLYFLFEVLKYDKLFGEEFIGKIVAEVKQLLTIPEEEEQPTKES